jgi:hypothetical protein
VLRDARGVALPEYTEARVDCADLTQVQPTEYRADERKAYVWPVYVANLRARLECPVCLLVVTADDATARWVTPRARA